MHMGHDQDVHVGVICVAIVRYRARSGENAGRWGGGPAEGAFGMQSKLKPQPDGPGPQKDECAAHAAHFHCSWAPLGIIVTGTAHGHHWASPGTAEIVGLATGYLFAEPHIKKQ